MKEIITQLAVMNNINKPSYVGSANNKNIAGDQLSNDVIGIINWAMGIIGLVCVIVIIVGGVKYMTSTGEPGKVKTARDTILYGIVGLIIVILASAIVNFVIANFKT